MKIRKSLMAICACTVLFGSVSVTAAPLPPAPSAGKLGYIEVNPYKNSPLSAVIRLDGHSISDVSVTVHGKGTKGVPINYKVGNRNVLTHDGIPVWGLYQDYRNKVTVKYTENGKQVTEDYSILTTPLVNHYVDNRSLTNLQVIKVKKVDRKFKDRLYMVNSATTLTQGADLAWVGPKKKTAKHTDPAASGGSLAFDQPPMTYMIDTQGEYRWWLNQDATYDGKSLDILKRGLIMSVNKTKNNTWSFVQGQSWGEFDLMGRVTLHKLPNGYIDGSHEARPTGKGTFLVRAAKEAYRRADGQHVHTVRDHILEIDRQGNLVDVWDLNKILDPLRDSLLGALDAGAVCLNVDLKSAGTTVKLEPDSPFGDAVGVGAGRNWAHVNSVEYDKKDDSIVLSLRHQGVVKINRNKSVAWILSPNIGWKDELAKKVLTPVDSKGNKLNCDGAECENTNFDWPYTQHTAFVSSKGSLTVFDNGGARGYEQPAMKTDRWSRSVEYKIDTKKMTVEQVWAYGKEKGYKWFSPITSVTELREDKNSMFSFAGSVGLFEKGAPTIGKITEIDYKTKEIKVEIDVLTDKPNSPHYRAAIVDPVSTFDK